MHILIVGSGSVGRRHGRNLAALGCRISAVDPRRDRLDEFAGEVALVGRFSSVEEALAAPAGYDGVVIGSPPNVHVAQALAAIAAGLPILLEKPVSPDLASARALAAAAGAAGVPVLLGYTWRWWPPLRRVRQLLAEEVVGPLRHVQFHMSAHLADWHPWEPYQEFFMASRAAGGGALLDESHWTDLALWFFGRPATVTADIAKLSDLDIDTDDNVDMLLTFEGGLRVTLHLDIFGRPHEKYIRFVGERGTLLWTADPNRIAISHDMSGWPTLEEFACERNDMFVDVGKEFLAVLRGGRVASCTLADGVAVLEVIEAARASSDARRTVPMESGDDA